MSSIDARNPPDRDGREGYFYVCLLILSFIFCSYCVYVEMIPFSTVEFVYV